MNEKVQKSEPCMTLVENEESNESALFLHAHFLFIYVSYGCMHIMITR